VAQLHPDMERLDVHVALEACDIVNESAMLVLIVFALSGLPISIPIGCID